MHSRLCLHKEITYSLGPVPASCCLAYFLSLLMQHRDSFSNSRREKSTSHIRSAQCKLSPSIMSEYNVRLGAQKANNGLADYSKSRALSHDRGLVLLLRYRHRRLFNVTPAYPHHSLAMHGKSVPQGHTLRAGPWSEHLSTSILS